VRACVRACVGARVRESGGRVCKVEARQTGERSGGRAWVGACHDKWLRVGGLAGVWVSGCD
jgi:hypothetical protein